jgi:hypothetical protein
MDLDNSSLLEYLQNHSIYKFCNKNELVKFVNLFRYLQNHSTYKIYCSENEFTNFVNKSNLLEDIPYKYISKYIHIYVEIISSSNLENTVYVDIWISDKLHFHCYSIDDNWHIPITDSKFFYEYPSLPRKNTYDKYNYSHNDNAMEILEKMQILNPEYRNKQFQNIIQICIHTIIYIKNLVYYDIAHLIIKKLLKLMPHCDDYIWHHQKIEKNNSMQLQLYRINLKWILLIHYCLNICKIIRLIKYIVKNYKH